MSTSRTKYADIFDALAADFPQDTVRWKPAGNRKVPYITARTVMNRLDEVLGPENWWDDYMPLQNGVMCRLTIQLPDGDRLTKVDAGGHAGMSDEGDDEKSGFSDAFKRAAVKFGVGRLLYGEPPVRYVKPTQEKPAAKATARETREAKPAPEFNDGKLSRNGSHWGEGVGAKPAPVADTVAAIKNHQQASAATATLDGPQNAADLMHFVKASDPRRDNGTYSHLKSWAKSMGFPDLVKDWTDEQAVRGFDELIAYFETRKED